jgi:diguanylate cyclase (GGDEF)-like protein
MAEILPPQSLLFLIQAIVFFALAYFLLKFYRGFGGRYVKHWSASQLFLAISFFALAASTFLTDSSDVAPLQVFWTLIRQVSLYLFLVSLHLGVYLACSQHELARKYVVKLFILAIVVGCVASLLFAFEPDQVFNRYYLRESLPTFIMGCCFLAASLFLITCQQDHFSLRIFAILSVFFTLRYLGFSFLSIAIPTNDVFQQISIELAYVDMGLYTVLAFAMLFWIHGAERAEAASQIRQAVRKDKLDALTGVMNREQLLEKLPEAMARAEQAKNELLIVTLDLRRFKFINDSYGLKAGDFVLGEVAERLSHCILKPCLVSRLSGDSFALVIEQESDTADLDYILAHIHSLVERPYHFQNAKVRLACSIGYTFYPKHSHEAEDLLRKANRALFHAETKNIASVEYQKGMQSEGRRLLGLESTIRAAFERGEFEMYYQPQLNLHNNHLEGVEALIRWNHPEKGLLMPGEFLPDIEELGLNAELDAYVLQLVGRTAAQWYELYRRRVTIAVNLTVAEFQDPRLVHNVQKLLVAHSLNPENIELEVTESTAMTDIEQGMKTISLLQNIGVKVSIDDFGTGHASLAYLRDLPIDKVKIDRTFITHMADNDADMTIVKSMINLVQGLGKRVLAEGVETQTQLTMLRNLGCDAVQGYHVSQPLPAADFEKYLARR